MVSAARRRTSLVAAALIAAASAGVGLAPDAGAAPPGPTTTYVSRTKCLDAQAHPATVANGVSWGQRALQFTDAWRFSRGLGVKIAVIDTGVNPGPEFSGRLQPGADLVKQVGGKPGLTDCDGHGTLVAGIIAASPDSTSGFTGVAPDATIISIRQSSENYAKPGQAGDTSGPGAGTRESLATAIDYAAGTLHANVINISLADCSTTGNTDLPALTQAVRDAVQKHNAVVVSAAGNLSDDPNCKTQNTPGKTPVTMATPADVDIPGVLAVGSVDEDGAPSSFSLAGSWVDVAAPGSQIVSSNPYPDQSGQVDKITTSKGTGTIQGTSFAAPYVSGLVALVRARFTELTAPQVTALIERTAAHPAAPSGRNDYVGYGLVDPVAALSDPQLAAATPANVPRALPVHRAQEPSSRPRRVALWGSLGVAALLVALAVTTQTFRSRRSGRRSLAP